MGRLKSDGGSTDGQVGRRADSSSQTSDIADPVGLERIIGRLEKGQEMAGKLTNCISQGRAEDVFPVFVASPDGRLLYANAAFREIHGALDQDEHTAPRPQPQGDRDLGDVSPRRRHIEIKVEGETRRFEVDRHVLRAGSGKPLAIFGRLAAVGELEAMRERLALSEERFRDIANLVSDWMWETDRDFRLTYVSPRVTEALGYRPSEVLGRRLQDLTTTDADDRTLAHQVVNPAPFRDRDITFRHSGGASRSFRLSSLPVYDRDSGELSGFRGTAQDVTELLAHEAALKAAAEAAQAANRTKSEFLANTSHELRTPLNAIIGFTEIMHQEQFGPIDNPRYKTYLSDVLESGYHLLTLINDILDVAKIEAGKLELEESIVDSVELCRQTLRLVADRAVRHGIELKESLPAGLPKLFIDERKIKQVLLNLLSNAIKFTPRGGTVEVAVRTNDDGDFCFVLSDTGIGIAEDDLVTALTPFGQVDSQLSRRFQGTGLGLPLANAMTRLHGGSLDFESAPGVGTVVTVRLPKDRIAVE